MKNLVVIDTNWPLNTRTERFRFSLSGGFNITVVAWRRDNAKLPNNRDGTYQILDSPIGYGKRFKKLLHLGKFISHSITAAEHAEPDVLFASHWDSLICAVWIKKRHGRPLKIIYDCLDLPTSKNHWVAKGLRMIERRLLCHVDLTIFASRHFKPLYDPNLASLVFENYPSRRLMNFESHKPQWLVDRQTLFDNAKKSISWIGVVRYFDILNNIVLAIRNTDIHFFVFGDGPALTKLETTVEELGVSNQVTFFGAYAPTELPYIYKVSNLVWAAYPTRDFNAIYAISNKYFECSYFSKRPILSRNTKMAESLKTTTGNVIAVDEYDIQDIRISVENAFTQSDKTFSKYEPDILWEDREHFLLDSLEAQLFDTNKCLNFDTGE